MRLSIPENNIGLWEKNTDYLKQNAHSIVVKVADKCNITKQK